MNKEDQEKVETLFQLLDLNKQLRLVATSEEQLKQLDKLDKQVEDKLKKLYVH